VLATEFVGFLVQMYTALYRFGTALYRLGTDVYRKILLDEVKSQAFQAGRGGLWLRNATFDGNPFILGACHI